MPVSVEQLRRLSFAYATEIHRPGTLAAVRSEIGDPGRDEVLDGALQAVASPDRNVREAMVRLLGVLGGERAAPAILQATRDAARRVRRRAVQACAAVLEYPGVADRLREILQDESEIRRIRQCALPALTRPLTWRQALPEAVVEAVGELARADGYRRRVTFLLSLGPLNDRSRELLQEIVRIGDKDEAVMATRALSGFRIGHIGEWHADPGRQRWIERNCDVAEGRVWYWVPREGFEAVSA